MAPPSREPKTAALVQSAQGGDLRAFGALIERHFSAVFVIALARLRDRDRAEDLAQEVFLRAQLHLHQLADSDRFEGWVCRMTRNLAIDWLRRGQRASRLLPLVSLDAMPAEVPDSTGKGAREIVQANEQTRTVRGAIMDLPVEQREVVLLHFTEELTQQEIAERLGINQATVSRQIQRALKALRGSLEPVLRETATAFKPAPSAVARSLVFAGAVGAMSASAKATLAASATVGQWTSAVETAQVGAAGAVGVIGFFKSLPALIAGGTKIMATGKGIVATITLAAAITGGGVYMGTQGGPIESGLHGAAVPADPGAYVVGDDGQWIALRETDPSAIEQIWARSQQGEDVEAIFAEMNLPVIPRVQELIVVAPDLEWTWDRTFQGGAFRLSDMEAQELEIRAEDMLNGAGPWRVFFEPQPEGDALVMAWVDQTQGPQRMWMARLGDSLAPTDSMRVVAVNPDGSQVAFPFFNVERGREMEARVEAGEITIEEMLDEMNMPVIGRQARLRISNPPIDIQQIEILETSLDQPELAQTVSMDYQPIPGEPNAWTGVFVNQLRGDFLSIPSVNTEGQSGAFAVRLRPLAAALLSSDAAALVCQGNLRRIRDAIMSAALDSGEPFPSPLTLDDLVGRPYFPERPVCPAGGVYGCSAGPGIFLLTGPPTCSIGGDHVYVPLPPTPLVSRPASEGTEGAVRARLTARDQVSGPR